MREILAHAAPVLEHYRERGGHRAEARVVSVTPDLLAAADVFIQTSIYEGQSNSVLEALNTGVPIVANDIPE